MFKTGIVVLVLLFTAPLYADQCQDPEKLSPELREAYYELKEMEKQIDGMLVSIRCRKRVVEINDIIIKEKPKKEKTNND